VTTFAFLAPDAATAHQPLIHTHHHHNLTLSLYSVGAHYSYCFIKERNIAFDLGHCPVQAAPCQWVFFTHRHGDHLSGILRHIDFRRLFNLPPAHYVIPAPDLEPLRQFLIAWFQLQERPLSSLPHLHGWQAGDQVDLGKGWTVTAFHAHHRVPSLGYALHGEGKPVLAYLGDHTRQTLEEHPELGQFSLLLQECTFLHENEREKAEQYGHFHLNDLKILSIQRPPYYQNHTLMLRHFSARYSRDDIVRALKTHLGDSLPCKVLLI
jgi:ribonuclease Z